MSTQNQTKSRRLIIAAAMGSVVGLFALGAAHYTTSHAAETRGQSRIAGHHHSGHGHRMHSRMHRQNVGEHIEGRLAFLKTELAITEAQAKVWNTFADTMRAEAKDAQARRMEIKSQIESRAQNQSRRERPTVIERLERSEQRLSRALEHQRTLRAAVEPLYAALSESQKEMADKLLRFRPRRRG